MGVRWLVLAALPLLMAMGDGRNAPPPVKLPGDAAVPGAGLNRAGQRAQQPEGGTDQGAPTALHVLAADEVAPSELQWQSRVVAVFADTGADPAFVRQLQELQAQPAALMARDVVIVTDTDPAAASEWRRNLRPEGFSLVVIDKDGQVKARKPLPWTVREIARTIDKFPSRLEETGRAGIGL